MSSNGALRYMGEAMTDDGRVAGGAQAIVVVEEPDEAQLVGTFSGKYAAGSSANPIAIEEPLER